jgi:hypothetical protein
VTTSQPVHPTSGPRLRLRGGMVGAGAAACAFCCTAPLMAVVGIGVTGAAATALTAAFAGLVFAAVVAVATVTAVVMHRRRVRAGACAPLAPGPVSLEIGRHPDRPGHAAP